MSAYSRRVAMRYRGAWTEKVTFYRDSAPSPAGITSEAVVISEYQPELTDFEIPRCVHASPLAGRALSPVLSENTDGTVVSIPFTELDGIVAAEEMAAEDVLWSMIDKLPRGLPKLPTLRRALRKQPRSSIVAIQARMFERVAVMAETHDVSLGLAGMLLSVGRDAFNRRLDGTMPMPLDYGWNFADLADVAEDMIGARIEAPPFGTAGAIRELEVSRAVVTRPRWLSWRFIAEQRGSLVEAFYFGERPADTSIREMLGVVDESASADDFVRKSPIETWFPDGVQRLESSFFVPYVLRRRGPEDLNSYLLQSSLATSP
ncbi:hypothetical protein [Protaetiibacter larvae]|uniref:Uncharacterized protein n=1 Tax=Protaetiibacter larvae TaxID=2592654 RepID=A0A5C1Y8R3_9MICO|nr:hypothetical protein [Protaetiibacter larvae]QEO10291.1 hypothetical protein FLP23_09890 [Protaetiibacter larvae]